MFRTLDNTGNVDFGGTVMGQGSHNTRFSPAFYHSEKGKHSVSHLLATLAEYGILTRSRHRGRRVQTR